MRCAPLRADRRACSPDSRPSCVLPRQATLAWRRAGTAAPAGSTWAWPWTSRGICRIPMFSSTRGRCAWEPSSGAHMRFLRGGGLVSWGRRCRCGDGTGLPPPPAWLPPRLVRLLPGVAGQALPSMALPLPPNSSSATSPAPTPAIPPRPPLCHRCTWCRRDTRAARCTSTRPLAFRQSGRSTRSCTPSRSSTPASCRGKAAGGCSPPTTCARGGVGLFPEDEGVRVEGTALAHARGWEVGVVVGRGAQPGLWHCPGRAP